MDPLSPSFPWWTPYQFAGNRPIVAIDLDGLEAEDPEGTNINPSTENKTLKSLGTTKLRSEKEVSENDAISQSTYLRKQERSYKEVWKSTSVKTYGGQANFAPPLYPSTALPDNTVTLKERTLSVGYTEESSETRTAIYKVTDKELNIKVTSLTSEKSPAAVYKETTEFFSVKEFKVGDVWARGVTETLIQTSTNQKDILGKKDPIQTIELLNTIIKLPIEAIYKIGQLRKDGEAMQKDAKRAMENATKEYQNHEKTKQ